eukprot:gene3588-6323_t
MKQVLENLKNNIRVGQFYWIKFENFGTITKIDYKKEVTISKLLSRNLSIKKIKTIYKIQLSKVDKILNASKVTLKYLKHEKLDDLYIEQALEMLKIEEILIMKKQIISTFIFEFQVFFEVEKINDDNENGFVYQLSEYSDVQISMIEENSMNDNLENWISSVQEDFPGYDSLVKEIINTIHISQKINSKKSRTNGILVHGISGTGKTKLVNLISRYSNFNEVIQFDGTQVYQSQFGESEKYLQEKFNQAKSKKNSILIIDHLEIIASTKETKLEKLVLSEFCYLLDQLSNDSDSFVFVIGITSDVNLVDINLRRIGRFEREFEVTVPTPESRKSIITKLLKTTQFDEFETLIQVLTEKTQGFVAADIIKLIRNSLFLSLNQNKKFDFDCFEESLKTVNSSIINQKKQNFESNFSNLVGIEEIKEKIKIALLDPLIFSEKYKKLNLSPPKGILLYGKSGVGKTSIARAIANEINANFVAVECTELISKYVGESSKSISKLFQKARSCSPCVLFFDQFEAIARKRGNDSSESHSSDRMLSTLLIEMDGISSSSSDQLIILAATSRIDLLDVAVLRPGRIDHHIELKLPNEKSRSDIFEYKMKTMPIDPSIDIERLIETTKGWTISQIENLCRESAMVSLREDLSSSVIKKEHFEEAEKILQNQLFY